MTARFGPTASAPPRRRRGPEAAITFASTHDALALEAAAQAAGVPGRLIPVPVAITADCGLAWGCARSELAALMRLAHGRGLALAGVYDLTGARPRALERGDGHAC